MASRDWEAKRRNLEQFVEPWKHQPEKYEQMPCGTHVLKDGGTHEKHTAWCKACKAAL